MRNLLSIPPLIRFTRREYLLGGIFLFIYVTITAAAAYLVPPTVPFIPAAGIAMALLFFLGERLWVFVFGAVLVASYATGVDGVFGIVSATIITLQSVVGAYLLRKAKVDPLFRRYRDVFSLIATVFLVALITPTLTAIWYLGVGTFYTLTQWGQAYGAMIFCLLIGVPLVLRWCAKRRFSRGPLEILETMTVFIILIALNYVLYVEGVTTVGGVPLSYFLSIPLFWIALRLRPRFVTLALLITSIFAIGSVLMHASPEVLPTLMFEMEVLLITRSIIFLIIVALEEDRRLNTNLMRSQVATLENAVARISTESRAKNEFIAILAHELRNPLAPVVSAIDLLRIKSGRDKEEIETLEMMNDRMKTVRRLLDDLLDVSRISEGKISIRHERVDLNSILPRAILSTEHHVYERHQTLVTKGLKKGLVVEGDPVRLEQIFSNLITNASKYSDSGDQISISVTKQHKEILISIKDQGVGIATGSLDNIFTPFHQVGTGARTQKGLGIGLALVKSFVEVHGGTVIAKSEGLGKGSEFVVRLPVATT
ncbi:MAG: two-component system, OmpR family, sensor histidine kinase VicK [Parcubacteria bacterium C7867-008]|nr:MAG: two-component system, OmpR family, sensor histidine kinase VicK [Parcubacteria bacterium C7867-008]